MGYRVMVKVDGMNQYQAVMQDDRGLVVAPKNKMYHSYFDRNTARKLTDRLTGMGIDCKIVKG